MWIFGYGSLMWRPGFEYLQRRPCYVMGWMRRFWQGSPDHRGVPSDPGRVVTLLAHPRAVCVGVAYQLDPQQARRTVAGLDYREKAGYHRASAALYELDDTATSFADAVVYTAGRGNPNFLGPAPVAAMAAQINRSVGPSGLNRDYLIKLAETLDALGAEDPHVEALYRAVAALQPPTGLP